MTYRAAPRIRQSWIFNMPGPRWSVAAAAGTQSRASRRPSLSASESPYFGRTTVSITWITPLVHAMSAVVTVALSTITLPPMA